MMPKKYKIQKYEKNKTMLIAKKIIYSSIHMRGHVWEHGAGTCCSGSFPHVTRPAALHKNYVACEKTCPRNKLHEIELV